MSFRNISSWAIRNPIPPLVLFAALTLAGIVSFMRMDVNNNPDVEFPAAMVVVAQPGAAPTELETQVTQRVEAAVRGITGVDEITSYVSEGSSQTTVQFSIGTPVDRAVNDVREAVSRVRSELPEGILEPQITRIDFGRDPIALFAVEGVNMTLEQLSWFVDNTVAKRLLAIEGMAKVERGGGVSREIRVILDPAKLEAQGLTAVEVNGQLRQLNLNAAGGRAEIGGSEQSLRVIGNSASAYALGQTQINVAGGRTVKLADIAEVRDLYAEQRALSKLDGRQVLSFSIQKAKGYSDVTLYDRTNQVLGQLAREYPDVHYRQLFTTADYVKGQYHSALDAMWEGSILAVFVVFLFLRDWRATLISAIAIPLSAIPTFWFMDLMGFSLNGLSLLALSLVAGVLVDDAIVEIENIVRHMRMGKSAYQASIDAADEIGLAVLATTMSIVAVFLPVGLMPGVSGQFFKNFGLTVVAAVLMSLAVARLITPMIAAYFLKSHGSGKHGEGVAMDYYLATLRWTLVHRWKTMLAGVAAFAATLVAFATLPVTFQPTVDTGYSQVQIEMPPGSTVQERIGMADRVARLIGREPDVTAAFAETDEGGDGHVYVTLDRHRKRTTIAFERAVAPMLRAIPDARINFESQNGGANGRDLNVTLVGDNPDTLNATALRVVAGMRGIAEIRAPRINGDLQRPEITVRPRFDLAADMGVTTSALSQTIRIATLGDIDQNVAKFSLSDRQIPIRVAIDENARRSLSTIENMPVPTANGGSVPLKVVADVSFGSGPSAIRRYGQERRISIGADLAPGLVSGDAQPKIDALPALHDLPNGVKRVKIGDAKWQGELILNFILAVIAGVLLVFAVLVLLYKRVLPPLVNLGSLLLAPLGGALALHLTGNPISMPVLIGLLMLLGIVAKNSILLVDFAIEEMAHGIAKEVAILDAGHKRAQPIVMTTVAMVAGMIPIAFSFGGDGSWRAPMGIVVMGGLLLSTVLTLLIVPAGFSLADDLEKWLGPRLGRMLNDDRGHRAPAPQPAE